MFSVNEALVSLAGDVASSVHVSSADESDTRSCIIYSSNSGFELAMIEIWLTSACMKCGTRLDVLQATFPYSVSGGYTSKYHNSW